MSMFRMTARIVGLIYIAGFVVGIGGTILVQSVLGQPDYLSSMSGNGLKVSLGAMLWMLAVLGDAAHGVLMFPVLKRYDERMAIGYLAARIVDAIFISVMVLFILLQIPLGGEWEQATASGTLHLQVLGRLFTQAQMYSYDIGMAVLGVSGLILCYVLFRARLVPRFVAVWGILGYAIILCGMVSEMMGSGLGLASSIPGGLWEVFMGGWLVVKGFNAPAAQGRSGKA